jgi:hydrogenase maturation protein HypF
MQPFPHLAVRASPAGPSLSIESRLAIEPDRVICRACAEEVLNRSKRRFRYPFAHCSHCGPRLSVVKRLPGDHANTAFAAFDRCFDCDSEYYDPTDRHFQAETTVCPQCGPRAVLVRFDGGPVPFEQHSMLDDIDAACSLIQRGEVVAIKGLGGWQLACDATNEAAVVRLRRAKQNGTKPLPLMARDLHVIGRYCAISLEEELELTSAQGPIVILRASGIDRLPSEVAPGLTTLGFMLPTTALHLLLLHRMNRPVVMTSGNLSGEPQILDDDEAGRKLGVAVRYALAHNYRIVNRVEDSVVRVMGGRPRLLRRARGYAPAPLTLPSGFERASDLVTIGGDSKAAFCLLKRGVTTLSPQYGDILDLEACKTYQGAICHFRRLLAHKVSVLAIDSDEDCLSSNMARAYAALWKLGLIEVDHPHAHIASCLAENGYALQGPPVLGIVLDGRGWDGDESPDWSGFLLADYRAVKRLAGLMPIPLEMRPRVALDAMIANGTLRHVCSGGALFETVAAALALCPDGQSYDGEAAMRLEAIVDEEALREAAADYPVSLQRLGAPHRLALAPAAMWQALLADLARNTPAGVIAARFHRWLARSIAEMTVLLTRQDGETAPVTTVALSGGCFQNRILLEETERRLRQDNFSVLTHRQVPPHSGGLAFGHAAVGGAQLVDATRRLG